MTFPLCLTFGVLNSRLGKGINGGIKQGIGIKGFVKASRRSLIANCSTCLSFLYLLVVYLCLPFQCLSLHRMFILLILYRLCISCVCLSFASSVLLVTKDQAMFKVSFCMTATTPPDRYAYPTETKAQ